MLIVEFVNWEDWNDAIGVWSGPDSDHWVPKGEQVWFAGTRYEVIQVEHVALDKIICYVKGIG